MYGERLMSDDDWHVYTSTAMLLLLLVVVGLMTVVWMSLLAERFLQLLMLSAYRYAVDVDRYRHHKSRCFPAVARHRRRSGAGKISDAPADSARQQRAAATTAALHHPRLDSLPLGTPVLEPDLDLDLAEAQLARDHGALSQRQVLLAVELLLELQQLVAGERRASASMTAAAAEPRSPSDRQGRRGVGPADRGFRRSTGRAVNIHDARVGR